MAGRTIGILSHSVLKHHTSEGPFTWDSLPLIDHSTATCQGNTLIYFMIDNLKAHAINADLMNQVLGRVLPGGGTH